MWMRFPLNGMFPMNELWETWSHLGDLEHTLYTMGFSLVLMVVTFVCKVIQDCIEQLPPQYMLGVSVIVYLWIKTRPSGNM